MHETRHRQLGLELGECAAVTLEAPVEQVTPCRIGERLEDVVVVHARTSLLGFPRRIGFSVRALAPDRKGQTVTKYFEDLPVGAVFDIGEKTLSEHEIIVFAQQFDPQPFHVDPEAALRSSFGGLVASGLQTFCTFSRLVTDSVMLDVPNYGGVGVDRMRWSVPVHPGDVLRGTVTVAEGTRPSRSKPDRGVLVLHAELVNQDDQLVWSAEITSIIGRRPA